MRTRSFLRGLYEEFTTAHLNNGNIPAVPSIYELVGKDYNTFTQFTPLKHASKAVVIKVYDGDTLTLGFHHQSDGEPTRISCRINGIDTPEIRGSSIVEKKLAYEAKEYLSNVMMGEVVTIMNPGKEKYGRVLCDLSTDEIPSISNYMLQNPRICKPYDGGTKAIWD